MKFESGRHPRKTEKKRDGRRRGQRRRMEDQGMMVCDQD